MLDSKWGIRPGDWADCADGRSGSVLSTCSWEDGDVFAVEVGFDWYWMDDIVSWIPRE